MQPLLATGMKPLTVHLEDDGATCNWGTIDHPDPRPDRGEVGHLVIVITDAFTQKPIYLHRGFDDHGRELLQQYTYSEHDGRSFVHTAYPCYRASDNPGAGPTPQTMRWTWELFPAEFDDGLGPNIMIGRWPD